MDKPLVLVVDDEPQIQRFLKHSLEASGYEVALAENGRAALRSFSSSKPQLVILDLGLPDMDGNMIIGQVRQTSQTPIIVLSARDQEEEKIKALDLGADDYISKPFGIGELLARIRACLRSLPAQSPEGDSLDLGALHIDLAARDVRLGERLLKLTPKEYELLALFIRNAGKVLTHRYLLSKIWGPAHVEDVAYLRVFIRQLRSKIEEEPGDPKIIVTEAGVGYRALDPSKGR